MNKNVIHVKEFQDGAMRDKNIRDFLESIQEEIACMTQVPIAMSHGATSKIIVSVICKNNT